MKLKIISLSLLLITLTACATTPTNSNEILLLEDGSRLIIDNGIAVQIINKSGAIEDAKKSRMMELTDGGFIYIRKDGTVNKLDKSSSSSHGNSSKSSSGSGGGHSH